MGGANYPSNQEPRRNVTHTALLIGDLENADGTVTHGHTFARSEQTLMQYGKPHVWAPAVGGNGTITRAIICDESGHWRDLMQPGDLPFRVTGADFYVPI